MKMKKYLILVVLLGAVCGIWTTLYPKNVMSRERAQRQAEKEKTITNDGENPTDGESERLRERIMSLEDTIVNLKEELKRSKIHTGFMLGLTGSLVDLSCVGINIEDPSLDEVRYGLTKKNILKAVESQLHEENIKTYYYPRDSENKSMESTLLYFDIADRPKLHIEVICIPLKGGLYKGIVTVSMRQHWDSGYPPDLPEAFKEQGISALKKTVKSYRYTTEWEQECFIHIGKLDDFAEDEKNILEELVGKFINYYLAANPTKGKDAQAILDYSKAIEINPRNAELYLKRGSAYAKQAQRGDYFNKGLRDKAISDFSKAIEIEPRNVQVYLKRAALYRNKGQYSMAILDYSKVIEIDPRNAEAYYKRANAYDGTPKLDQAIADYTKVIEIDPRNAEACYRRGMAYYFKEEYDKAWEDVHKAQTYGFKVRSGFLKEIREMQEIQEMFDDVK